MRQLVQAQGLTPLLDDNKKGEKKQGQGESSQLNIQVTKVLVPSITLPVSQIKDKLDSIDLINLEAAELKLKEQRKKMEENMYQVFGPTSTTSTSVKHVTKLESITVEKL